MSEFGPQPTPEQGITEPQYKTIKDALDLFESPREEDQRYLREVLLPEISDSLKVTLDDDGETKAYLESLIEDHE